MLIDALRFANVALAGLAAGTILTVFLAVMPRRHDPETAVRLNQAVSPRVNAYNRVLVVLALLTGVALAVVDDGSPERVATIVGVLALVGIVVIGVRVEAPVDATIKGWSPTALPADATTVLARWDSFHSVRTALAIVAFLALVVAAVAE